MRSKSIAFVISIALLVGAPLGAQTVVPTVGPLVVSGASFVFNPNVAPLPGGDFVVVWFENYVGVRASVVSGGSPGGPLTVASVPFSFSQPDVDSDSAGNFMVVWDQYSAISGQRYDSSAESGELVSFGTYSANRPQIGMVRSNGDFVLSFNDGYYCCNTTSVAGFNADASVTRFGPFSAVNDWKPRLAVDPAGNFVLVWRNGYTDLSASTFNAAGSPIMTFPVYPASYPDFDVAASGTDQFVVVWTDSFYLPKTKSAARQPSALGDVMARKITTTGVDGGAFVVSSDPGFPLYVSTPKVAANSSYFVVVWDEYDSYGGAKGAAAMRAGTSASRTPFAPGALYAQPMTIAGSPIGGPIPVAVSGSYHAVSMDDENRFTAVWKGNSINASQWQITQPCPTLIAPSLLSPANAATVPSPVTFEWSAVAGATQYELWVGIGTSPTLQGTTAGTSLSVVLPPGFGDWYVVAKSSVSCPTATSVTRAITVQLQCPTPVTPTLVGPADGAEFAVGTIVRYEWTAATGAAGYQVWASVNGAPAKVLGSTANTFLNRAIEDGTTQWYVVTSFGTGCTTTTTGTRTVITAAPPPPPPPPPCGLEEETIPSIVGESTTGETYVLRWDDLGPGVSNYHVQESANVSFTNIVEERTVAGLETAFTHPNLTVPTPFYYRVAGIPDCDTNKKGPYSVIIRVVVIPKPEPSSTNPQVVTEFGNTGFVDTFLFIEGFGGSSKTTSVATFEASSNEPWLVVSPSSGNLPSDGITVKLTANAGALDLGANTATVLVTRDDGLGKTGFGSSTKGVPVAVSLVTPIKPVPKGAGPPDNALIIPAVANVPGINTTWFSDVKVTNRSNQLISYELNFTATDRSGTTEGKQTKITIRPNQTVALDDVVRQWFGQGNLNDGTNGALEIRPLNFSGKVGPEAAPMLATVASSRTYTRSESSLASYGQFIPGTPFSSFLKSGVQGALLTMQQVSQTANLRTNFGLVEGAGKDVNVLMTAFDREGVKLGEFPVALKAGEHKQLNSFLAMNGISVQDGRMTVQIVSGEGAVTSYASVVASGTGDPSLVPGVDPSTLSARKYVLPGVADLRAGGANWRSDVRIFNANQGPESVNAFFYPQGETTPLGPVELQIAPGQVRVIEGVVESLFGRQDLGGALHIVPISGQNTSLVVTGETYDVSELGKYGQFISGVTEDNAIGVGSPGLEVMQVESSAQFRTNLGIAELTGQQATVQIQLTVPNSLIAPTRIVTLGPNEFQQLNGIVAQMSGGRDVYNGRLTVRVTGGAGKVTAYGSTVDNQTQDATYSPGQ